jgi:hypothetical protein
MEDLSVEREVLVAVVTAEHAVSSEAGDFTPLEAEVAFAFKGLGESEGKSR